MTWIAEHPLLSALVPLWLAVAVWLVVVAVRMYRRRPAVAYVEPERTVVDDLRDVPDDRPGYEDDPQAYTADRVARGRVGDQALFRGVHRHDEAGWEPGGANDRALRFAEATELYRPSRDPAVALDPMADPDDDGGGWGDDDYPHDQVPQFAAVVPSAALTTGTSQLRALTGYTGHSVVHEGEIVDPPTWYPPMPRALPALPLETNETPLIGLDMHAKYGHPIDRYTGPVGPSGGFTTEWNKDLLAAALAEGERLRLEALRTGVDPQLSGWPS